MYTFINTDASEWTSEGNRVYFITSVTLFFLLTVSVFTNVGLTVVILRIKGKSSCTKSKL